jgi:Rod binding domain-containing protein
MTAIGSKAALASFPPSRLEHLKGGRGTSVEAEKVRLRKATQEFESFFNYYMLKTMRKTIPTNDQAGQSLLSTGNSKDIFNDIFDTELARMMSLGRNQSVGDMLYKAMEKLVDAGFDQNGASVKIKGLKEPSQMFELPQREFREVTTKPSALTVPERRTKPISFGQRQRARGVDEIMRQYNRHIQRAAEATSLDPVLIASVITAESNGDRKAVSSAGAKGLMQLIDSTAADYGVKRVFDAKENISAGSRYLKDLIDRFGDVRLALAAYNAGPGNVVKYNGVPPFEETRSYVDKVLDTLEAARDRTTSQGTKVENRSVDIKATHKP